MDALRTCCPQGQCFPPGAATPERARMCAAMAACFGVLAGISSCFQDVGNDESKKHLLAAICVAVAWGGVYGAEKVQEKYSQYRLRNLGDCGRVMRFFVHGCIAAAFLTAAICTANHSVAKQVGVGFFSTAPTVVAFCQIFMKDVDWIFNSEKLRSGLAAVGSIVYLFGMIFNHDTKNTAGKVTVGFESLAFVFFKLAGLIGFFARAEEQEAAHRPLLQGQQSGGATTAKVEVLTGDEHKK